MTTMARAGSRLAAPAGQSGYWRMLSFLALAAITFAYQETSVLPALHSIDTTLPGATTSLTAFLESGYLVIAAVAAPTLGKLGDRTGKKRFLVLAMLTYFVGALGAGLAPSFAVLVVFRAIQGVAGAIFALSFAITRDVAPDRVALSVGVLVGSFGVGITAGFASSGVVTADLGWRFIFFIEAGLILLATALVARYVPEAGERTDVSADLPGSGLLGLGVGALIIGLTIGPVTGWVSPVPIGLLVGAAVASWAWVARERRVSEPLIDIAVLTQRDVMLPNLGSALAGYATFSVFLAVPKIATVRRALPAVLAGHVDYGFALPVTAVGLVMVPIGLGMITGGPTGGVVGRRYGGKWPFVGGLALVGVTCALLAGFHDNLYAVGAWLYLLGAGFGLSVGAAGTFVTEAAPRGSTGVATAFNSLVRLVGGGIGAQVGTIIVISGRYPGTTVSHQWTFVAVFAVAAALGIAGALASTLVPGRRSAPGA
ncbi:MAG: MFS transporter [Acidimicrobiales bacterium]